MSTAATQTTSGRQLLVMAAPPAGKRVKDMSQEEIEAWANAIFETMARAYRRGANS